MRIIHKGLLLILGPLVPAVLAIAFLFNAVQQTYSSSLEENLQIRAAVNAIQHLLIYNDIIVRTYLIWLQEDAATAKKRLQQDMIRWKQVQDEASELDSQGSSEPELRKDSRVLMQKLQSSFRNVYPERQQHALVVVARIRILVFLLKEQAQLELDTLRHVHPVVQQILADLDTSQRQQQRAFQRQVTVLLAGIAVSSLGGLLLAWWLSADISRRINILAENMHRFTRGQPLAPPVGGRDEIAKLDDGFHKTTELLRSAMAKERALFESASDIICITDSDLCITDINPAWSRMLGRSEQDSVGKSLLSVIAESDRESIKDLVESLKRDSASSAVCDIRAVKDDGTTIDLMWSLYWSALDMALYATASDISDRKRVQNAKDEFLATVSHDLRAPLSSIRSSMDIVLKKFSGALSSELTAQVSAITSNVSRMLRLLDDLLDLDRLQSTSITLTRDWVSVEQILRLAIAETEALSRQKKLTVQLECEAFEFFLDEDRVVQVVVNLLSNAIKYSPDSGTIRIDCKSEPTHLQLSVTDEGPGVPTDAREAIFDRFKQANLGDSHSGSGLGLSICKSIVENHGGKIWVEEADNGGSRFVITLPTVQTTNNSAQQVPKTITADAPPAAADNSEVRIRCSPSGGRSWFANLRLIHKIAIIVSVPIVAELIFAASLSATLTEAAQEQHRQLGYHKVMAAFEDSLASSIMVAASIMSPEVSSTQAWSDFEEALDYNQRAKEKLRTITAGFPALSEAAQLVSQIDAPFKKFTTRVTLLHQAYGSYGKEHRIWTGSNSDRLSLIPIFETIVTATDKMMVRASEDAAMVNRNLSSLKSRQQSILLAGLGGTVLICLLSVLGFSRGIAQRLSITANNMRRLETDQPLGTPLEGKDEVAQLDQMLHSMAASLNEIRRKEHSIFDNSQDVMCALSRNMEVLRINRASQKLLGYRAEELAGTPLHHLMPKEFAPAAMSTFANACDQDDACTFECPVLRKDGSSCEMLWSLSWSATEQALIAIGHDITSRKQLERLKQDFFAMVSHDMRTPITSISNAMDMIANQAFGPCPAELLPYVQIVARSCDRLLILINDLLDLERLAAGEMPLTMKSIPALSILRSSEDALLGLASEKNIKVHVAAQEDVVVYGDADRLVQVAVNLLSNAIKFSPEGSAIELAAEPTEQAVTFRVKDSGCGIAESQQGLIFDRYWYGSPGGDKRSDSKGLGLAICKKIIEQHGGTIGVTSELGHGSTFQFSIPIPTVPHKPADTEA